MIAEFNVKALNPTKLKELRKQAHLDQRGFATLSNSSRETVIKFEKDGKVSEAAKRSFAEAARLVLALNEIMESKHIADWLKTPNPGLQNRKPIDLIKDGRVDIIWRIVEETRQGSFS